MTWNWQLKDWPNFSYEPGLLEALEDKFLQNAGFLQGAYQHINDDCKEEIFIDIASDEAVYTSEIEGSYLNRGSIQLSLKQSFGMLNKFSKLLNITKAEQGIVNLVADLHSNFASKLTSKTLFSWHKMITSGRSDLQDIGKYRTHTDDMQIVSGPAHKPKIHFVAPPSHLVEDEMKIFIDWFNNTRQIRPLTKAGLAHLYFLIIHPFEDGNGRIARALSEKVLFQALGQPQLMSISTIIRNNKKAYYDNLNNSDTTLVVNDWLKYFADVVIEAQEYSYKYIEFIIKKAKFYDKHHGSLNERQQKVVARIFANGIRDFEGGLSAENYISITKVSRATATRDLQDLVEKKALVKKGTLKSTRYYLNIE